MKICKGAFPDRFTAMDSKTMVIVVEAEPVLETLRQETLNKVQTREHVMS
jgi:hypothetical protein